MRDVMNEQTSVKNRFGFRKLSVGLTTVFLGSIFFLGAGQPVHADEVSANGNSSAAETAEIAHSGEKSSGDQSVETNLKQGADAAKSSESTESIQNSEQKITSEPSQSNLNNVTEKAAANDEESTVNAEKEDEHKDNNAKSATETSNESNSSSSFAQKSSEKTDKNGKSGEFFSNSWVALDDSSKGPENGPEGLEGAPAAVKKLDQQINGAKQQTVKDELPDLGLNDLTLDQLNQLRSEVGSIDSNESLEDQGITLTWKTKPDVDAVGTSHGVAELTYTDNTGDTPQKRTTIIKIDVDVREGQKKNAGQVRNRLTYIDADSNQIVESYDWVGNKNTDNEKFSDMQYVLDQAVEGLGYGMVANGNSDIQNLAQFGDEDQTINRFVRKISEKPLTWSQAEEKVQNNEDNESNKLNYDTPTFVNADGYTMLDANDPATLIANVGTLPTGTEITWEMAPKFDDNGIVSNTPVISVKEPKKAVIEITLNDEDKAQLSAPSYDYTLKWKNEPLVNKVDKDGNHIQVRVPVSLSKDASQLNPVQFLGDQNKLVDAIAQQVADEQNQGPTIQAFREEAPSSDLTAKVRECILDPEHKRWSWTLEPDLKKAGYTIGFAKFTPLENDDPDITNALSALVSSMGIRMKVEPQIVKVTDREKDVTRKIIVTDPDGNKSTIDQVVHFTSTGERTLLGGPVENIQWDAGTNNGQWDEFVAPAIEGYTAVNSPVAAEKVTPTTANTAVQITYKKISGGNPGNGGQKTTPTNQPTEPTPATPQVKPETTPTPEETPAPQPTVNAPVPHGEKVTTPKAHKTNVTPHGQNGPVNKVAAPHGEMGPVVKNVVSHKGTVAPKAQVVPNKKVENTLPQTGSDQTSDEATVLLGGVAVAISMVGLAGVKKRKNK